jgi:hypothetical protein
LFEGIPNIIAGAMNSTEARIAQTIHFLVAEESVIEIFIAVKCVA